MKKMLFFGGLLALTSVTVSGCTSFAGITQADKPGSYYLATNAPRFPIGNRPNILLCTPGSQATKLDCQDVEIEYK